MKKLILTLGILLGIALAGVALHRDECSKLPIILGFEGTILPDDIAELLKEHPIEGVILFERNIPQDDSGEQDPAQLKVLVDSVRKVLPDAHVLIDQEGGRIQRLKGANFFCAPPLGSYGSAIESGNNQKNVLDSLRRNVHTVDAELSHAGIDVNCTPCCDLLDRDINSFISDRSFGYDKKVVEKCAMEVIRAMNEDNIISVCKHCPGHGSAEADSHKMLPTVKKTMAELDQTDFDVFRSIAKNLANERIGNCWYMVSHVAYDCIEKNVPATVSRKVIDFIREKIGFGGTIITDCITMNALSGPLWERTIRALWAGCDIVLCCHGSVEEYRDLLSAAETFLRATKGKHISQQELPRLIDNLAQKFSPKEK